MSGSVQWQAINGADVPCNAVSKFCDAMEYAYGDRGPWIVSLAHASMLRGMAAAWEDKHVNPFRELECQVQQHDFVRVWLEY